MNFYQLVAFATNFYHLVASSLPPSHKTRYGGSSLQPVRQSFRIPGVLKQFVLIKFNVLDWFLLLGLENSKVLLCFQLQLFHYPAVCFSSLRTQKSIYECAGSIDPSFLKDAHVGPTCPALGLDATLLSRVMKCLPPAGRGLLSFQPQCHDSGLTCW